MTARKPIPKANSTRITSCPCGCGLVQITLYDDADRPFAAAAYSHRVAIECAGALVDAAEAARNGEVGVDERVAH